MTLLFKVLVNPRVQFQGTRKRRDGKFTPGEDLPLHVMIRAPDPQTLQKGRRDSYLFFASLMGAPGIEVVQKALIPVSEEERRRQLKQLGC